MNVIASIKIYWPYFLCLCLHLCRLKLLAWKIYWMTESIVDCWQSLVDGFEADFTVRLGFGFGSIYHCLFFDWFPCDCAFSSLNHKAIHGKENPFNAIDGCWPDTERKNIDIEKLCLLFSYGKALTILREELLSKIWQNQPFLPIQTLRYCDKNQFGWIFLLISFNLSANNKYLIQSISIGVRCCLIFFYCCHLMKSSFFEHFLLFPSLSYFFMCSISCPKIKRKWKKTFNRLKWFEWL